MVRAFRVVELSPTKTFKIISVEYCGIQEVRKRARTLQTFLLKFITFTKLGKIIELRKQMRIF